MADERPATTSERREVLAEHSAGLELSGVTQG
jgi:hypothetical protein